jgi:branched-chain amino acid transport system permease protein
VDAVITQLANGLALGFIYVLMAVGLSMIFGQLGLVNFAHGAFLALTAYVALTLYAYIGWAGVVAAPVIVAVIGMVVERLLLFRAYGREPRFGLIITFALSLLSSKRSSAAFGVQRIGLSRRRRSSGALFNMVRSCLPNTACSSL